MEAIQMPGEDIRLAAALAFVEGAKLLGQAAEFVARYDDDEFAAMCAVEGANAYGGMIAMRTVMETVTIAGGILAQIAIVEGSIPADVLAENFPGRMTDEGYVLDPVSDGKGGYL